MNKDFRVRILIFALIAILLGSVGCTSRKTANTADPSGLDGALPQVSSFADDIKDIAIPPELEWKRADSLVIKTESFRGGVLVYTGKTDILSLKDYMVASMKDNQWRMVGETASKYIMLAFVKPNKTCMMVISESFFKKTELRMYVAIDNANTGSVNPFGEVIPQ